VAAIAAVNVANATSFANDDCSYFYNLGCSSGDATTNPPEWEDRAFQTYLPGSDKWVEAYEGLGRVMCYEQITYSADRTSATVEAKCRTQKSVGTLLYNWNGIGFNNEETYNVSSDFSDALTL
jgi:hypothetical protein